MLLLLLFVATATAARSPELLYKFTRGQCAGGVFSNLAAAASSASATSNYDQSLFRTRNATACAPSLGVTTTLTNTSAASLDSNSTAGLYSDTGIFQSITPLTTGISFELWFKTGDTVANDLRGILAVQSHSSANSTAASFCDTYGLDFLLTLRSNHLEVYFTTGNDSSKQQQTCSHYLLSDLDLAPDKLTHVIVSLRDGYQLVIVNGHVQAAFREPFSNSLSHWNTLTNKLVMFSNVPTKESSQSQYYWQGTTTYQLAIYAGPLTDMAEIRSHLLAGLPQTLPYALNYTLVVNEDAETIPESHAIEWYRKPPALEGAQQFQLQVGSVQQQVLDLLQSIGLRPSSSVITGSAYVYVTSLPAVGFLYQQDGTKLENLATNESSVLRLIPAKLIYLPPFNQHSSPSDKEFTHFTYCVSDHIIFDARQCESSQVQVRVVPVNDPPIATRVDPVTVQEGFESLQTPKILLTGTDVDENDFVNKVQITRPPGFGQLLLSVSSFRQDDLYHGLLLKKLNFTIPGPDPVRVKYIWDPAKATPNMLLQGSIVTDSFTFRVADRSGAWSLEEKVTVNVASALEAYAQEVVTIQENSTMENNVEWYGKDLSGYKRRIGYYVESIPPLQAGMLIDSATRAPVSAGMTLNETAVFPYHSGALLSFIPSLNYCSSEGNIMPEVRFRTVSFDVDTNTSVHSISNGFAQKLNVECLMDPLIFTIPTATVNTTALRLRRAAVDPCYGAVFDPSITNASSCEFAAIIDGIKVEGQDLQSGPVRVTVTTSLGYVSFNSLYWNLTQPIYGRRDISQNTTFLALPHTLSQVLSSLHYQSFESGYESIVLRLQYGACTSLNNPALNQSLLVRTEDCQILQNIISVHIRPNQAAPQVTSQMNSGFPWQIFFCWVGYPVVYLFLDRALNSHI
jgi:hypothetical protein